MHGLKLAGSELDREVLADLAVHQPESFASVVAQAKSALDSEQKNKAATIALFQEGVSTVKLVNRLVIWLIAVVLGTAARLRKKRFPVNTGTLKSGSPISKSHLS